MASDHLRLKYSWVYRIKESLTVSANNGNENSVSTPHSKYREQTEEGDTASVVVHAAASNSSSKNLKAPKVLIMIAFCAVQKLTWKSNI